MSEMSPSPYPVMQLALGFWSSKALLSAVEIGLFTALAQEPADAPTLCQKLALHPRGARDFFDALVALGMLERRDGRYSNTAATQRYLVRGNPDYIGGIIEMSNARLYGFWGSLTEALRTGMPQNESKQGGDLFGKLYADPDGLAIFLKGMTGVSRPIARQLAARIDWKRYGSVIDIGTAEGTVPVTIAQAHPHVSGGGFDLPPVRPVFERNVRAQGLERRLRFHPGDFFKDRLPAADVLVMGHILHDWDLAAKRQLLAKAYAALPQGGVLIVYDMMIDDDRRTNATGLLMSLNMLIETRGGFDYTGADCAGWMQEAGFAQVRVEVLEGPYAMAVATK
jgi:O-methyltransferase/methyltransferase family protein